MVLKYAKNGEPYREPPYTLGEELEMYRREFGAPVMIVRGPRPGAPAASQPPAEEPEEKPSQPSERP